MVFRILLYRKRIVLWKEYISKKRDKQCKKYKRTLNEIPLNGGKDLLHDYSINTTVIIYVVIIPVNSRQFLRSGGE